MISLSFLLFQPVNYFISEFRYDADDCEVDEVEESEGEDDDVNGNEDGDGEGNEDDSEEGWLRV